jgi:hypothetical protein
MKFVRKYFKANYFLSLYVYWCVGFLSNMEEKYILIFLIVTLFVIMLGLYMFGGCDIKNRLEYENLAGNKIPALIRPNGESTYGKYTRWKNDPIDIHNLAIATVHDI